VKILALASAPYVSASPLRAVTPRTHCFTIMSSLPSTSSRSADSAASSYRLHDRRNCALQGRRAPLGPRGVRGGRAPTLNPRPGPHLLQVLALLKV
jgi:hypothetical protein